MIRDILLQLNSHPAPSPDWIFAAVVPLAERFGARLSIALCQPHIPEVSNYLADKLVGARQAIAEQNRLSREQGRMLAHAFTERVTEAIRGEQILIEGLSTAIGVRVGEQARVFDLAVMPMHQYADRVMHTQDLVFGAGRPVLLLPEPAGPISWKTILIGWDGGSAAARALADALPFCRDADAVRLVAVSGEKPIAHTPGIELARDHLRRHDVPAEAYEIAAEGSDAGTALLRHAREIGADLVVAGAFGHSRLREFILGGATNSLIAAPTVPVLLSH